MLTIGVLGGMGPAASLDFFRRLVSMVGADRDQDHPPCILYNATQTPDRTEHLLEGGPDPTADLLAAARVLEQAGAALVAIPCNSAHAYHGVIQEAVSIPVLDMIALAADAVARQLQAGARVGVLGATGTVRLGLYDRWLRHNGLVALQPDEACQADVMASIRAIKAGARGRDPRLDAAIRTLVDAGAEALMLACTELPFAVDPQSVPVPLVDAGGVLAATALAMAGVEPRERDGR